MERFSVSVDAELAEWIEAQADERGVSKAKVIRDAVETARTTGLVHPDASTVEDSETLVERIEALENRVAALEAENDPPGQPATSDHDELVAAFEAQLADQPPTTEHGQEAVVRVFFLLLEHGPMETRALREELYPDFEAAFASPDSMWQSINRYFDSLDGIEKIGHGEWDADPESVDTVAGE